MSKASVWAQLQATIPRNSRLTPTFLTDHYWLEVRANDAHSNVKSHEEDQKKKQDTWNFVEKIGFHADKLLCIHRWKVWWMIPRVLSGTKNEAEVPAETYLLVGQLRESNEYLVMLSAVDDHMSFSLEGEHSLADGAEGISECLVIHGHENSPAGFAGEENSSIRFNSEHSFKKAVLVSRAPTGKLYSLLHESFSLLKQHLQGQVSTQLNGGSIKEVTAPHRENYFKRFHVERGPGPSFVDYFGWCTWDSFYTDLSMSRLIGGLSSFETTGVTPRFLILDDGWQHTTVNDRHNGEQWGGRLTSFNANFKFSDQYVPLPNETDKKLNNSATDTGSVLTKRKNVQDDENEELHVESEHSLLQIVREVKAKMGIRYMLAWHAFAGYWGGVQPQSSADQDVIQAVSNEVREKEKSGSSGVSSSDDNGKIIVRKKSRDAGVQKIDAPDAAKGVSRLKENYGTVIAFPELNSSLHRMAKSGVLESEPYTLQGVGLFHPERADHFYDHYHRTLHDFGIDGVKVDVQSVVPLLRHYDASSWDVTTSYHRGLQKSVGTYFGRGDGCDSHVQEYPVIHCMCHSQATLWSILAIYPSTSVLGRPSKLSSTDGRSSLDDSMSSKLVPVVRGSDDFYPTEPFSHCPHIFVNAINSLLMSYVGLHDWDMFQSGLGGDNAFLHAAARAISGGPVYVSDRPGEHNTEVIRKLAFPGGRIPRCIRNAHPVEQCLFDDPHRDVGKPLLIQNINAAGALVVGAFNLFGSLLENDVHYWRPVTFDEVNWPDDFPATRLEKYRTRYDELQKKIKEDKSTFSWFMDDSFNGTFTCRAALSPSQVEEARHHLLDTLMQEKLYKFEADKDHAVSCTEFVSFRHTDGKMMIIDANTEEAVDVELRSPGDYDIVSFAPKHFWTADTTEMWFAALGATEMFNPTGTITKVQLFESQTSRDEMVYNTNVHLLGDSGRIQFVVTTQMHLDCDGVQVISSKKYPSSESSSCCTAHVTSQELVSLSHGSSENGRSEEVRLITITVSSIVEENSSADTESYILQLPFHLVK